MIWHNPKTNPPKVFADVLLAVRGQEEASEGWRYESGSYQFSTGHPVVSSDVYAWTELPKCPRELDPSAIASATEEVQS